MSGLWLSYKIRFCKNKQTNQYSAVREQAWQHNKKEGRQPSTGQKRKNKRIERFKLFLDRGINTVHKFMHKCDSICLHVNMHGNYAHNLWRPV